MEQHADSIPVWNHISAARSLHGGSIRRLISARLLGFPQDVGLVMDAVFSVKVFRDFNPHVANLLTFLRGVATKKAIDQFNRRERQARAYAAWFDGKPRPRSRLCPDIHRPDPFVLLLTVAEPGEALQIFTRAMVRLKESEIVIYMHRSRGGSYADLLEKLRDLDPTLESLKNPLQALRTRFTRIKNRLEKILCELPSFAGAIREYEQRGRVPHTFHPSPGAEPKTRSPGCMIVGCWKGEEHPIHIIDGVA